MLCVAVTNPRKPEYLPDKRGSIDAGQCTDGKSYEKVVVETLQLWAARTDGCSSGQHLTSSRESVLDSASCTFTRMHGMF